MKRLATLIHLKTFDSLTMKLSLWNVRLQLPNGRRMETQVEASNLHNAFFTAEKQTGFKAVQATRA